MLDELQFRISSQQYENLAGNLEANVTVSGSSSATSASSTSSASATATAATSSDSRGTSVAPIVGGVVGAVLGIALMALGIYFVVRRRKQAYSKLVDAGACISLRVWHEGTDEFFETRHRHAPVRGG